MSGLLVASMNAGYRAQSRLQIEHSSAYLVSIGSQGLRLCELTGQSRHDAKESVPGSQTALHVLHPFPFRELAS